MLLTRFFAGLVAIGMVVVGVHSVRAQTYPSKPIRIITGGIGGGSDFTARLVGQTISGPLGQPVIVDNRPTGIIPGQVVSQAPPDGYTLLVASSLLWNGPLFNSNTPYDAIRDFAPITSTEISPSPVVVHPSLPVKSIAELIALAKAKPGELNYGTPSIGSAGYLAGEIFKSMAGVNIVCIVYSRGAGAAVTALMAGETQVQFGGNASMAHIKAGRLRALAVTSAQPTALFPGLPTVAASGLPGYEAVGITAIFVPAKTPEAIIRRLNEEVVRALSTPEIKEKFFNVGVEAAPSTPEQLAARMKAEIVKVSKVIKEQKIPTQ